MGRELTPEERRDLLGAYAIGAVDDDERVQVEELVLRDPDARAELHTLQLGVAWLDHASTRAPMHVWREIEREIERETDDDRQHVAGPPGPAPVFDLGVRRARGVRRLLAVAAVLVVALVATVGVVASRDSASPPSVAALAARAEGRPGSTAAPLRAEDGARVGTLVVTDDRQGYVVWRRPPTPTSERLTYQLWELTPDGPRSAGVLGPAPRDRAFRVGPGTSGVAVTLEPRGGSPAPTGTPVVSATLA